MSEKKPITSEGTSLSKSDFETDQDVRWCPGCGDYSVLAAVQRFLPSLGIPREKYVFVSGIGCSSRFPYYMNTYGFHTIHGRAPAIATGIKVTNPDLSVWIITGDGDALSIGGNHLLHILRRNLDVNLLLFNNRIYGLTKGQYSPTSEVGKVTKSTPVGSLDYPLNPLLVALGARGSFIARTLDVDAKHMTSVLEQAVAHRGTSFIEIYQNCNVFNDGAFTYMSERKVRDDAQIQLVDGEALIFGKDRDRGIAFDGFEPRVVTFAAGDEQAAKDAGVAVYDKSSANMATAIARMEWPEFPVPMGVLYQEQRAVFNELVNEQVATSREKSGLNGSADGRLRKLFSTGDTWEV